MLGNSECVVMAVAQILTWTLSNRLDVVWANCFQPYMCSSLLLQHKHTHTHTHICTCTPHTYPHANTLINSFSHKVTSCTHITEPERRAVTSCGHSFCSDCIHEIIPAGAGTAPCPICRCVRTCVYMCVFVCVCVCVRERAYMTKCMCRNVYG
jgi:hypothetical protein